ncbi:MAG: ATP-dependent DNA helicase, partial [Desulfatitalea sp.]
MAEGDLAMLALRTADNLRHIVGLRAVFPQMADAAKQAIDLILRDPVMPAFPSAIPEEPAAPAPTEDHPHGAEIDAPGEEKP